MLGVLLVEWLLFPTLRGVVRGETRDDALEDTTEDAHEEPLLDCCALLLPLIVVANWRTAASNSVRGDTAGFWLSPLSLPLIPRRNLGTIGCMLGASGCDSTATGSRLVASVACAVSPDCIVIEVESGAGEVAGALGRGNVLGCARALRTPGLVHCSGGL